MFGVLILGDALVASRLSWSFCQNAGVYSVTIWWRSGYNDQLEPLESLYVQFYSGSSSHYLEKSSDSSMIILFNLSSFDIDEVLI